MARWPGISMEYVDSDTLRNRKIDQPNEVFSPRSSAIGCGNCARLDYAI